MKAIIEIEHPEWLPTAFKSMKDSIRLIEGGLLPEVLRGRFLVGNCMHILRCIYGSDLASVVAIRQRVLDDVTFWQKIDAMTPAEQRVYFRELEDAASKEPTA